MINLLERISIDPKVCFGKPCIRGTRIWVSLLLDCLASGASENDILAEYPQLAHEGCTWPSRVRGRGAGPFGGGTPWMP